MSGPEDLLEEARREIAAADSAEGLESVRVKLLGRKGRLTGLLREIGELPPEERPKAGADLNKAKFWGADPCSRGGSAGG